MVFAEKLFLEAKLSWDMEKLYIKVAEAKQLIRRSKNAKLTPIEKAMFRGLLCNYSPKEIATYLRWSSVSLKVELTRGLYRYIETATAHNLNTVKNWRNISIWLEEAGYKITRPKINYLTKEKP